MRELWHDQHANLGDLISRLRSQQEEPPEAPRRDFIMSAMVDDQPSTAPSTQRSERTLTWIAYLAPVLIPLMMMVLGIIMLAAGRRDDNEGHVPNENGKATVENFQAPSPPLRPPQADSSSMTNHSMSFWSPDKSGRRISGWANNINHHPHTRSSRLVGTQCNINITLLV